MADFDKLILTRNGRRVLAQAQTGLELRFTRIAAGDGEPPDKESIPLMTDLVHFVVDLPINGNTIIGDGTTQIDCKLSNKDLEVGYELREVGIFAYDHEATAEVMYAYTTAGDLPDYIPAGGGPHAVDLILSIVTVIKQALNVTVEIAAGYGFITSQQLEKRLLELYAPHVKPISFWTADDDDPLKLRPTSIPQAHEALFEGTAIDESVLIGFDPIARQIFGIPLSRLQVKALRLRGGTPTLDEALYDGNLRGGTPVLAEDGYDGRLFGGDPYTY